MPDDSLEAEYKLWVEFVDEYGWTWFRTHDGALAALQANATARAEVLATIARKQTVGTDTVFLTKPDRWLPSRTVVQDVAVESLFAQQAMADAPPVDLPVAALLMGLPGSGKTSALRPIIRKVLEAVDGLEPRLVDADEVRSLVPEYEGGLGSQVVDVETSYLTYRRVVEESYKRQQHLIIDTVGDPIRSVTEARFLTNAGWTVMCLCATVSIEIAQQRAMHRALATGRYVPAAYIEEVGDRPLKAYEAVVSSDVPLLTAARLNTEGKVPIVEHTTDPDLFAQLGDDVCTFGPNEASGATDGA
jgi:hypothetical protein